MTRSLKGTWYHEKGILSLTRVSPYLTLFEIVPYLFLVCDKRHVFKDAKLLYRFRKDDGTFPFNTEVKIFMRGQRLYEQ